MSTWSSQGSEALWELRRLEGEVGGVVGPFFFTQHPTLSTVYYVVTEALLNLGKVLLPAEEKRNQMW